MHLPHLLRIPVCALLLGASTLLAGATDFLLSRPGDFTTGPDSLPQAGVPAGKLEGPLEWRSAIFPGTVRRYWIWSPENYTPDQVARVLVFHDGQRATNPNGPLRVPQVLANLVHKGEIPLTIGIFITPGHRAERYPDDLGFSNPNNRAEEYDVLSDAYARMVAEEILPEVGKRFRLSNDPHHRIVGGTSSGGICAFTMAWQRPDQFRNVISFIGSYVGIAYRPGPDGKPARIGGDLYPTLIRKNPPKPLTIFLQDGSNDLSNEHGDWFLANQQILSALTYANAAADKRGDSGPRYKFAQVWTDGKHSDDHGGAMLPDVLRWMWGSETR